MNTCRRFVGQNIIVVLAVCFFAAGMPKGNAATAEPQHNQHPLSAAARANADRQIAALMADKAQWTPGQKKLDTQLIFAARLRTNSVVHPLAVKLRPSLTPEADGRVKVDIKATVSADLLAAIEAAGGTNIISMPKYHFIRAILPVENLEALAARADVKFIQPYRKPRHNAVDSEGDTTHQAITARATYSVTGAGVSVGVLSDSIDNGSNALSMAITSGNINPSNTFVLTGQAGTGEGEGLAMCEVVHDLAPGATIYFATGAASEEQMAENIISLANYGCTIITDDESYADESPFQDGVIAQAVKTVCAEGVLFFSCARNSGNLDSTNSATWEGDFTSGGSAGSAGTYLAFVPGVTENEILPGGFDFDVNLFWSDPLGAADDDYDLYMLDSYGDVVYSSQNTQDGSQDPYEHIDDPEQYSAGYYLAVTLYSGSARYLHLDFGRGVIDYATTGCVRGHNACDVTNSFCVAATPAKTAYATGNPTGPYPGAFNTANKVEYFSADGARRMFYNADGSAITPGNYSSTGGKVFLKPDFTAADGVTTTPPGFAPFFGTSCAAPHAAAIAALVASYNPLLSATQVRQVLTNSCIDIMAAGWDRDSGWGILMAPKALQNTPVSSYFLPGTEVFKAGQFQATVVGAVGSNYNILYSTNLTTWTSLETIKLTNVNSVFTDTHATTVRRFYESKYVP
jgi:hypothetical protein